MEEKEKIELISEPKLSFVTLFKMFWKAEPQEKKLEDVVQDSDISKEDIEELKKSQKNIEKLESDLFFGAENKKTNDRKKFKYESKSEKVEAMHTKNETKIIKQEKERE